MMRGALKSRSGVDEASMNEGQKVGTEREGALVRFCSDGFIVSLRLEESDCLASTSDNSNVTFIYRPAACTSNVIASRKTSPEPKLLPWNDAQKLHKAGFPLPTTIQLHVESRR